MDESNRRRSTVLKSLDRMCEQLASGDKSVAETMIDYMELTSFTENEESTINMTIEKAFKQMDNQKIVSIQENLGIYTTLANEEVKKFYMWLNARLEKLRKGEWTIDKFFEVWLEASNGIIKKIKEPQTTSFEKIGMTNIVIMVNELK